MSATSSFPPQPPSRSAVNIIQRHDPSVRPPVDQGSPVPPTIPPPFVLQPQPQWDPQTFVPYTPPEFASWSQPSGSPLSSARSSFSAFVAHDHRVSSPVTPPSTFFLVPRRTATSYTSGSHHVPFAKTSAFSIRPVFACFSTRRRPREIRRPRWRSVIARQRGMP
ncbi:hypothetical protein JVU11DRAFT_6784 [Chiua virens]|nr:hypothetical protein JVU11DRAFT_6784 [Chiua virens]